MFLTLPLSNSEAFLAAPIMILFWVIGYVWKRTLPKSLSEIDLDVRFVMSSCVVVTDFFFDQSGRKSWLTVEEMREVRLKLPSFLRFPMLIFSLLSSGVQSAQGLHSTFVCSVYSSLINWWITCTYSIYTIMIFWTRRERYSFGRHSACYIAERYLDAMQ